jgi:hypothetical protein
MSDEKKRPTVLLATDPSHAEWMPPPPVPVDLTLAGKETEEFKKRHEAAVAYYNSLGKPKAVGILVPTESSESKPEPVA